MHKNLLSVLLFLLIINTTSAQTLSPTFSVEAGELFKFQLVDLELYSSNHEYADSEIRLRLGGYQELNSTINSYLDIKEGGIFTYSLNRSDLDGANGWFTIDNGTDSVTYYRDIDYTAHLFPVTDLMFILAGTTDELKQDVEKDKLFFDDKQTSDNLFGEDYLYTTIEKDNSYGYRFRYTINDSTSFDHSDREYVYDTSNLVLKYLISKRENKLYEIGLNSSIKYRIERYPSENENSKIPISISFAIIGLMVMLMFRRSTRSID